VVARKDEHVDSAWFRVPVEVIGHVQEKKWGKKPGFGGIKVCVCVWGGGGKLPRTYLDDISNLEAVWLPKARKKGRRRR